MNRQLDLKSVNIEQGLNQSWIRHDDPVNDSRLGTIQDVIAGPTELQALQVDIGLGREWWVTRLYFLSSITAELTPIEVIIFLGETGKFIGVAHPRIVQERLLQSHPVLKNYETALQAQPRSPSADLRGEVQRRADCWQKALAQEEQTSPIWVTKRELSRWLAPYMITRAVDWEPGSVAALQMQRLLDWPMRFVPVVEKDRFVRVVDKQALTDQIARIFVREQVLRALSTTR